MAIVNFTIIFWVDKWLLLRFYRTPKNYDEQSIQFAIGEMKYAFLFHFLVGSLVYSNDRILSNSGQSDALSGLSGTIDPQAGVQHAQGILQLQRYNSLHVLIFLAGNIILLFLIVFERAIVKYLVANFTCFKSIQRKFEQMDAISDDYYEVMSLKFLVSEYERTK